MSHDWERLDAIEEPERRPWPILTGLVMFLVALGIACWPEDGPDVDEWRREETRQLVARAHQRMRADSLASVAQGAAQDAMRYRQRYTAARDRLARWQGVDTVTLAGLPPVRGGWGGVVLERDTLPTPRLVIALVRERDTVIARADSTIHAYRVTVGAYSLAIPAYQRALAHGDSALAASTARRVAEVSAVRRSRWRWMGWAFASGLLADRVRDLLVDGVGIWRHRK